MFGNLLAGKFSNKCKHAVKFIKARVGPIRNKKQAKVRFLKKDVADLVAAGHETNAFGRIDALIVEINHTSCYDMIEGFCQYILDQLPSLQKQRECPQEAMEAIATLIFAAARFPDLPELCDLRHVFRERYGTYMESAVNAEFVDKFQKKSFSKGKKLQLMQNISEEFSVRWVPNSFDHHSRNTPAPESARPKEVAPPCTGNNGASAVQVGIEEEIPSRGRHGSNPISVAQRKQMEMEPKDIHVISTTNNGQSHDPVEKIQKVVACGMENMKLYQTNNAVPQYVKPRRKHDGIDKDEEIKDVLPQSRTERVQNELDPSIEKEEAGSVKSRTVKPVSLALPYSKPKGKAEETRGNGIDPPYTKLNGIKNRYHTEEKNGNVWLQRREEGLDPTGLEKQSVRPLKKNGYVIPPYVKPRINDIPTKGDQTAQNMVVGQDKSDATEDAGHQNDGASCDEKPKPISVRRKFRKLPVTGTNESAIDDEKPTSHTPGGRGRHASRQKTDANYDNYVEEKITIRESRPPSDHEIDNAIDYGKLLPRASNGRIRHGSRHAAAAHDGQYDEEEMVMDNLLLHYSGKGTAKEPGKERTRARAYRTNHVNLDRAEYPDNGKAHQVPRETVPPPERAVSLLSDPVSPAEAKVPIRAISMHPDPSNPHGGRVHPKLPEYDQLPARLAAIRKT